MFCHLNIIYLSSVCKVQLNFLMPDFYSPFCFIYLLCLNWQPFSFMFFFSSLSFCSSKCFFFLALFITNLKTLTNNNNMKLLCRCWMLLRNVLVEDYYNPILVRKEECWSNEHRIWMNTIYCQEQEKNW